MVVCTNSNLGYSRNQKLDVYMKNKLKNTASVLAISDYTNPNTYWTVPIWLHYQSYWKCSAPAPEQLRYGRPVQQMKHSFFNGNS